MVNTPGTLTPSVLRRLRQETPACEHVAHLNNAGAALMPEPVIAAMSTHLALERDMGGYEAADHVAGGIDDVYTSIARFLCTHARNIAIVADATAAFAQVLSAFDFAAGDRIVTTEADYVSHQLMLLALAQRRGVEIVRAANGSDGAADPDHVGRLADHPRCRLVSATWMPTNSGLVQDVQAIGAVCRQAGVPYVIDACQAVGQVPIDLAALPCDFLTATGRKFLRGPRGIGFLYVSDWALDHQLYPWTIDLRGAAWSANDAFTLVDSARRFEHWERPYALVLGLGAAVDYAIAVGIELACIRARSLAARLRTRLAAVPRWRVLDDRPSASAIVSVSLGSFDVPRAVTTLRRAGYNTSATFHGWARFEMGRNGVGSALRISPHYYNTEDEIDRFVLTLQDLLGER